MLKPFINVVKVCRWLFVICVIISIILEFDCFSYLSLLQQFSIGAACSFIVVVVSTYAQYRVEFEKVFSKYISATYNLLFALSLYQDKTDSQKLVEHAYNELESQFENFRKSESGVLYFTKRKNQKFFDQNAILHRIYIDFLKEKLDSHEKAVNSVADVDRLTRAIDTYLEYWPDCFEKEQIKMFKKWLEDDTTAKD